MNPTTEQITKQGYIEGPDGTRYPLGSPEATNYLLSQGKLPAAPTAPAGTSSVLPGTVTTTPDSTGSSGGDLLSFKDAVSQALNLAKEKRNAASLGFMAPLRGTVAASDFGSILGNLNKASDTFAEEMVKNQAEKQGKLTSEIVGNFEVLRDQGGKVISARAVSTGGSGSKGIFTSGGLTTTKADLGEGQKKLEDSRGQDNYADPQVYLDMYKAWQKNGGLLQDFLKLYPPQNYVNPDNTWLPYYLMPKGSDTLNFGNTGAETPVEPAPNPEEDTPLF